MIPMKILRFYVCLFIVFCFFSCGNNDTVQPVDTFDRSKFLQSQLETIILPRLARSNESVNKLQMFVLAFVANPTLKSLQDAQQEWISAYQDWIRISFLDFGPGEGTFGTITENIGTFPVRVQSGSSEAGTTLKGIETLIAEGDYSLNNFFRDTRGFLGLEYLLFSDSYSKTLNKFTTDSLSENRKKYTTAVVNDIKLRINELNSEWNGSYKTTFLASNGTDVGSSTSLLYNAMLKHFEQLKNFKIGVPGGLRAGQTKAEPEKVEGYYSGFSSMFALIHFGSIKSIYNGYIVDSTNTIGFTHYLRSISGGEALIQSTQTQMNSIDNVLEELLTNQVPLSKKIQLQDPLVSALYTELSKLTRFIKSDMSSLMGISITFSSGDGD